MTGRSSRRHRWVAAAIMGLAAAGGTVAQVSSSGALPPVEAISATGPSVGLPPLVVTPPTPPLKREAAPVVLVPTVPKVEPPPVIVVPTVVPTLVVPPVIVEPVKPVAPATPVSLATPKAAKPAIAEIIREGPKTVEASASFAAALADAKAAYGKVRDYTGHMLIQERVKGVLQPEQTAEIRVKAQPRSVALSFIAPSAVVGREIIFVDGRNGNKVRVKAAGTFGPLAFATVLMSDPKAAVNNRLTLADSGIGPLLERIERDLATEAKMRNEVAVIAADFSFAGKTVTRYELFFDRPHALRDAARLVICIDPDTKLPVRLEAFDAPTAGKVEGDLRDSMSFVNLTFNQGIGDGPFEK